MDWRRNGGALFNIISWNKRRNDNKKFGEKRRKMVKETSRPNQIIPHTHTHTCSEFAPILQIAIYILAAYVKGSQWNGWTRKKRRAEKIYRQIVCAFYRIWTLARDAVIGLRLYMNEYEMNVWMSECENRTCHSSICRSINGYYTTIHQVHEISRVSTTS